jgi:hypothetical protein
LQSRNALETLCMNSESRCQRFSRYASAIRTTRERRS